MYHDITNFELNTIKIKLPSLTEKQLLMQLHLTAYEKNLPQEPLSLLCNQQLFPPENIQR